MNKKKLLIKKIKLRTWVALGLITIFTPIILATVYGVFGALGGSSATPVVHLAFDEGVDNTCSGGSNDACDKSGHGNDGAFAGSGGNPSWQPEDKCISGKCLYFDGSNDTVTINNSNSLDFGTGDITVMAWVRTNIDESAGLITYVGTHRTRFMITAVNSRSLAYGIYSSASWAQQHDGTAYTMADGKWHHVAAVYDRDGSISVYKDGQLINTLDISSKAADALNDGSIVLGFDNFSSSSYLEGYLDEVKIFDSALTDKQIQAEFTGGAVVLGEQTDSDSLSDGLAGYFRLNDKVSGNGKTISDMSGSGNHLTTVDGDNDSGMDCTVSGKFSTGCQFDGDDTLSKTSPTNALVLAQGESITLSAWIKPTNIGATQHIISNGWSTTEGYFFRLNSQGRLQAKIEDKSDNKICDNAAGITGTTILTEDKWHQATFTWDAQTGDSRLYLNGKLEGSCNDKDIGDTSFTSWFYLASGTSGTGAFYEGYLDEVRIYSRALSEAEVGRLYNWAPRPVAYWNFDEQSGTTAYDRSGNAHNGSITSATYTQGKFGNAIKFDGSGAVVTIDNSSTLNFSAQESFTSCLWLKLNSGEAANGSYIFDNRQNNYNEGYFMYVSPTTKILNFGIEDTDTNTVENNSSALSDETWYHACGVRDVEEDVIKLYINGSLVDTDTDTTSETLAHDESMTIGLGGTGTSAAEQLNGLVDDFIIYNYARTPQQIIQDMNAGHPTGGSPISSLVAHYKFDEQHGQTVNNSGNTGSLINGTLGGASTENENDDPTWLAANDCKLNGCLSFDGGDYLSLATGTPFHVPNKTLTFWAKPNGNISGTTPLFSSSGANWYAGFNSSNVMFFSHSTAAVQQRTSSSGANVVIPDEWHHYAYTMTVDGDNVSITYYRDGVFIETDSYTTGHNNSYSNSFVIGAFSGGTNYFNGAIDEVKFYNSTLSQEQILIDYNGGASTSFSSGDSEKSSLNTGAGSPPIGYWNFDENTGEVLNDISGNGNNATIFNADWTKGKTGAGLEMKLNNDTAEYALVSDPESGILDFGDEEDFTASIWFKAWGVDGPAYLIYKGASSVNDAGYMFRIDDENTMTYRYTDGNGNGLEGATVDVPNIFDGKWHYAGIIMDYDGDEFGVAGFHFFLDGQIINSDTSLDEGSAKDSTRDLYLGELSTNFEMNGSLDEAKIFDYALSPSQIAYEYNRGAPVAWWKFDDCSGDIAHDSSGNENHGTVTIGEDGTHASSGSCSSGESDEAWSTGLEGRLNGSLYFDGTDDWVADISQPKIHTSPNIFTITGFIKPESHTSSMFITPNSHGWDQSLDYDSTNQRLILRIAEGGDQNTRSRLSSTGSVPHNQWTHFAVVINNLNIKIYINGVLDAQFDEEIEIGGWVNDWAIGQRAATSNTFFYKGYMDDIRVYNYELSAQQIKNIINGGAAVAF